jgi:dipeptidyl-peptidase-4
VSLHRADGAEVRLVDAGPGEALRGYRLATPEFVQAATRDGFVMEALLFKPLDFDPRRKYPVYQFTYGGPQAPRAVDKWDREQLFHQLLVQRGVVVWICDNRTASGKGAVSAWPAYQRLGEQELLDIEDGLAWLKRQPWVDAGRIGLHGRSYGGFMTSYALTHSASFRMGIAGSSVTDWRDYDSIYTERYMKTPQNNPDGYRRTAPRFAAENLHGRMLLVHGTTDDNVHMQNSIQFAYELQRAGKPFEMMLYPRQRHSFNDARLNTHLRQMMYDFVMRTLVPAETISR